MLASLEAHLASLLASGASDETVESARALVERQRSIENANMAASRARRSEIEEEQLSGAKRHAQNLQNVQEAFNLRTAVLDQEWAAATTDSARNAIDAQRAQLAEEQRLGAQRIQNNEQIKSGIESTGLVTDFRTSPVGKHLSDMGGSLDSLAVNTMAALQPQNLFAAGAGKMVSATKELFFAFDDAQSSLAKTTGTTGEYNDMLYDIQEQNKGFNVDVTKAGESISALHNKMASFNQLGGETQSMLATTGARLQAIGVDAGASAEQFDNMIMGMGMSADAANDASLEMVALGSAIGVSADKMSADFNAAASDLASYGPEATNVFKDMAAAAKATGIEMSALLDITTKMDTFEGAAESAGKMNAILGGGLLNSMDLLNASEGERVRMLIESVQASGKSWESMNKFEKIAVANAAGISDMTEANKMFSMSLSAYDEMQDKADGASASQAILAERAAAATNFMDKLKKIGQAFAVAFMPLLEMAHGFADGLLAINDATSGFLMPALVAFAGILALIMYRQRISLAITGVMNSLTFVRTLLTSGLSSAMAFLATVTTTTSLSESGAIGPTIGLSAAFWKMLIPVLLLTPAILGLGMAMLGIGLAIAAPLILLTVLVWTLKEVFVAMLQAPQAILAASAGLVVFAVAASAAMILFSYAIAISAGILMGAAPALFVAGIALTYFGIGMMYAALPMLVLAKALGLLGQSLKEFAGVGWDTLAIAAAALLGFTVMMIFLAVPLGVIGLLVGIPLLLIGIGLSSFAKGLSEFNKVGIMEMVTAGAALLAFTVMMIFLAVPLGVIGLLMGIPLLLIGIGLSSFAKGLSEFNKVGLEEMGKAALALLGFTAMMIFLAVPLAVIGILVGLPLLLIGLGLMAFAKGIQNFNDVGWGAMAKAGLSLLAFTAMMVFLIVPLYVIGMLIAIPLLLIAASLTAFAYALEAFNEVGPGAALNAVAALGILAFGLIALAAPLAIAAWFTTTSLILLGSALYVFGLGMSAIGENVSSFVSLAAAIGIISLFGLGAGLALGLVSIGMMSLAWALWMLPLDKLTAFGELGQSLQMISKNVAGLERLETALSSIQALGIMTSAVMSGLAVSILGIALALMFIPESKAIAFSTAMGGYGAAMSAVAQLTPESVTAAEKIVQVAGEYAEIQAEMKLPAEDAFVQALTKVFGGGAGGGKGGQDIVLTLNGKEFGRAVDAAINKKHNLKID